MWIIDKSFNFEMGHRVWAQELKHTHLSISTECACKHLHGHSYTLKVFLKSEKLDQSSMVTDFKNLNFMKQFIDTTLDHKFMIDINDPNFELITSIDPQDLPENVNNFTNLGELVTTSIYAVSEFRKLHLDSFVLVNFVPTSENICVFLSDYAQSHLKDIATVSAVELWETQKSHCRYER